MEDRDEVLEDGMLDDTATMRRVFERMLEVGAGRSTRPRGPVTVPPVSTVHPRLDTTHVGRPV